MHIGTLNTDRPLFVREAPPTRATPMTTHATQDYGSLACPRTASMRTENSDYAGHGMFGALRGRRPHKGRRTYQEQATTMTGTSQRTGLIQYGELPKCRPPRSPEAPGTHASVGTAVSRRSGLL